MTLNTRLSGWAGGDTSTDEKIVIDMTGCEKICTHIVVVRRYDEVICTIKISLIQRKP